MAWECSGYNGVNLIMKQGRLSGRSLTLTDNIRGVMNERLDGVRYTTTND
jgi:hypothetical protein